MSLFVLVLTLLSTSATPPSGALHGVVRDAGGSTVANARVDITCAGVVRHVTATAAGVFSVTGLPEATCEVSAKASGFGRARVSIAVTSGTNAFAVITLAVSEIREDVFVSATRGVEEASFWVPESTSVTTRAQLEARPFTLMPQVLREEAGIEVQQTTSAQTSPIIRGFTGQSNVYLVDGVRMNTAAWRSGPSQYTAWIDGAVVDRLEVVRGPGSVQFGSDALGGTVNVRTLQPSLVTGRTAWHGGAELLGGTADRSAGGSAHVSVQGQRAALRVGVSDRRVGALRAGGGIDSHAAVTRFLGLPNTTMGPAMRDTGFAQKGAFVAGTFRVDLRSSFSGLYLHEDLTGSSRYDRTYGGDGVYRSGFTPQTLDFGYLKYQTAGFAGFDAISATVSVNRQQDGRFEQTRPTAVFDHQAATTAVYGLATEATRSVARRHQLTIGGEYYDERITASRALDNVLTGVSVPNRPDVPTGTTYSTLGAFAQNVTEVIPGRLTVRGGVRVGRYRFTSLADTVFSVPAEDVTSTALTYNAGAVFSLTRHINATFSTGRGFRAANAADLGDIGLTGGGGFSITPSRAAALGGLVGSAVGSDAVSTGESVPALRPEVLYSYEAGLKFSFGAVGGAVAAYAIEYLDSIQRRAIVFPSNMVGQTIAGFTIVRQDTNGLAYIQQDARPVGTRVNVDRARLQGIDADMNVRVGEAWTIAAYFSMTNGRLLSTSEPLRRIPPPIGGARVRWAPLSRVWVEAVMAFARTQTRMNAGDLTDARIGGNRTRTSIANYFNGTAVDLGLVKGGLLVATGETLAQVQTRLLGTATAGTLFANGPGWVTVGLRAAYTHSSYATLTVIGENLLDRNYRVYGSGVDAPGRNVQVRLTLKF